MRMYSYLKRIRGDFFRSEQGVGAIEFALTAPILLLMVLGSMEFAHYVWASESSKWASSSLGKLYAQHKTLHDARYRAIAASADLMAGGYATGGLEITTTSVLICKNPAGIAHVRVTWERGWNGSHLTGTRRPGAKYFDLENPETYAHGSTVLITEVKVNYEPRIKYLWAKGITSDENPTFVRKSVTTPIDVARVSYDSIEPYYPIECT